MNKIINSKSHFTQNQNICIFQLFISNKRINIRNTNTNEFVSLERPTCQFIEYQQITDLQQTTYVSSILGIVGHKDQKFLLCAQNVKKQGNIQGQNIYLISKTKSFQITSYKIKPAITQQIQKLLQRGFYFCSNKDITRRLENKVQNKLPSKSLAWASIFREPFIKAGFNAWVPTIINGFVLTISWLKKQTLISITLISRRSNQNQGKHWNKLGLSDNDMVSNFIENQLITQINQNIFSVVAVRGNVPLFWSINQGSIEFTRNAQMTNVRLVRHITNLNRNYGKVFILNLLQRDRSQQHPLIYRFEQLLKKNESEFKQVLRYRGFQISKEYKVNKQQSINQLMKQLNLAINHFGMFWLNKIDNIQQNQKGIFRVNCFQCYGKSNFILSRIIFQQLKVIMSKFKFLLDQQLIINYNYLWIRNHHKLIYTGIYSQDFKLHKQVQNKYFLQAPIRFQPKNTIKLQAIQTLTLHSQSQIQSVKTTSKLSVYLLTWNINGTSAKDVDLQNLFADIKETGLPDILAFGLQQMVELTTTNVLVTTSRTNASSGSWQLKIKQQLCKRCGTSQDQYLVVEQGDLVGLFNLVLIHSRIKDRISDTQVDIVKTGYGGKLGNKGAALIRFRIDSDMITFMNCHLQAGQKKLQGRLHNLQDIHEKAFMNHKKKSTLLQSQYVFLFGDLNFRVSRQDPKSVINALNTLIESKLEKTKIRSVSDVVMASLKPYDQLILARSSNYILKQYQQGQISFLPTYKFEKGGQLYTSRKQRCPSWCDRILVRSRKKNFIQKSYNCKYILESDHRPVSAQYEIQIQRLVKQQNNK